ncbi:MAG: TRAP transporter small permease [Alphaproteobacteria bacterium]
MPLLLKIVRTVDSILGTVVATIVFLMMALIVADAIGRALHIPIPGVVEITEEYLMIAVVFLSLGLTQSAGQHIKIEIFGHMWPFIGHRYMRMAIDLAGAIYFGLIAWFGGGQVIYAWQIGQRSASELAYPLAPAFALVVVGSIIMGLWLLIDVAKAATGYSIDPHETPGAP